MIHFSGLGFSNRLFTQRQRPTFQGKTSVLEPNFPQQLQQFQAAVGEVFKAQGKNPEAPLHQVLGPYKAAMAEITQGKATGELLNQQVRPVVHGFYQGLVDLGLVSIPGASDDHGLAQAVIEAATQAKLGETVAKVLSDRQK
jgi:hypothetical protein